MDAGFASGTRISTFYDSMLAKVIGHGPTRAAATQVLARSLSRARLHGVVTNRDLLVGILREPEFQAAAIDTGYLDRHPPAELCGTASDTAVRAHALAAALADQATRRRGSPVLATLPSGWRNNPSAPQRATYELDGRGIGVSYRIGRDGVSAEVEGIELADVLLHSATPRPRSIWRSRGTRRRIAVTRIGDTSYVDSPLGHTALVEVDRFPDPSASAQAGSLLAPMPGTVVRVDIAVGDLVEAGASILAIEAMKMEHTIHAPARGIVTELPVAVGAQVDSGVGARRAGRGGVE